MAEDRHRRALRRHQGGSAGSSSRGPRPRRGHPHREPRARPERLDGDPAHRWSEAPPGPLELVYREEWGAPSRSSSASSATSSSPRTRSAAFAAALSAGRARACLAIRAHGSSTTARNSAIDRIRREQTFRQKAELLARLEELPAEEDDVSSIPDERLALVFTCCHPRSRGSAQVALTLREVAVSRLPRSPTLSVTEATIAEAVHEEEIRTAGIPFRSHPITCCPIASPACLLSCTWSSTRATPPCGRRPRAATSEARRSG